jgi:hypothetical protein
VNSNKHYNTLYLFARGGYGDYKLGASSYIEFSKTMLQKLRILTLLDIAKDKKVRKMFNNRTLPLMRFISFWI